MASSYSLDLRDRVVAFVEAGHSRRAAGRRFAVSESFSIKLVRRVAETGSSEPGRRGRSKGGGKLDPHADFLVAIVEAEPDIKMPELAALLDAKHAVVAAPAVLSRFLCRCGFTYKKSADGVGVRALTSPRRATFGLSGGRRAIGGICDLFTPHEG